MKSSSKRSPVPEADARPAKEWWWVVESGDSGLLLFDRRGPTPSDEVKPRAVLTWSAW